MATVTVIILAKNEEQHMKDCIASAQFADEVLLIDDGSTDKTVEIAKSMGARVVHHAMNGDWSQHDALLLKRLGPNGFSSSMQMNAFRQNYNEKYKMCWLRMRKKHTGLNGPMCSITIRPLMVCCDLITCCDLCQKRVRI